MTDTQRDRLEKFLEWGIFALLAGGVGTMLLGVYALASWLF